MGCIVADSWVWESFVLAAIHIGQVMMFLGISNKVTIIICSTTFYLNIKRGWLNNYTETKNRNAKYLAINLTVFIYKM